MRSGSTALARESRELRPFFVRSTDDEGNLVDVTSDAVEVAFARLKHRPETWTAAAWQPDAVVTPIGTAWVAELEIGGPGTGAAVELYPGQWYSYVRVTTADEQPVLFAGVLTVQ